MFEIKKLCNNEISNLTPNRDIILEAKRMILTEQLDRVANMTLSEIYPVNSNQLIISTLRCEELNIPKGEIDDNKIVSNEKQTENVPKSDNNLLRYYFTQWKRNTKRKLNEKKNTSLTQKEKIEQFLDELKKQKGKALATNKRISKSENFVEVVNEQQMPASNKTKVPNPACFTHRLKAQQEIIDMQKTKLLEQNKIIENMKLGIIQEEVEKSIKNSNVQIREIFRHCSGKVRCKITPPAAVEKDVDVIEMKCSTVPKLVQQMEKRAEERLLKRQIIMEKKKMMDAMRKKQVEEAIENKRIADEEQRQKNLEAIKERRQKELEIERMRQINKQKYLHNVHKANNFCNKKLKSIGFRAFKEIVVIKNNNMLKSEDFYEHLIQRNCLNYWKIYTKDKIMEVNLEADILYSYRLRKNVFKSWKSILTIRKQGMQVAQDLYDMRLESKTFIHWHRYVCIQQMQEFKKFHLAQKHYNSRILLQYFYQWKSLSAVLQLEKAKEEKKKKWREKVWEILPDYNPCLDD